MKVHIQSVAPRAGGGPAQELLEGYLRRIAPYFPVESRVFRTEAALLGWAGGERGRTAPALLLLDSRGAPLSSEGWAGLVREYRDGGVQRLVFAVGPADGWSAGALRAARRVLSLGPMTFPHELARVLVAEQVYRACTILAGHPYHSGH